MNTSVPAATLLPAIARGDVSAFETLYDRYASTIYALLLRILCNTDDAQEVLQETFVKAWTSAKMFDALRGSEVAWLISIARSRGIDRLRSRRIRYEREDEAGREISVRSSFVEFTTGSDMAIQSQERTAVRGALAELPEPQRRALELAYFEGLSQSEIAAKLNEPLGTIKTRMQLGMKKLRDRLQAFQ
ncbi:MAG TPA: sigma-70 family RNA polymerase sigma factor [Thermoanaerobaculia bacterium]|nr:sigma-70 family RNA polymerase sigma factor [Thermoanaerobaculia bacterium]